MDSNTSLKLYVSQIRPHLEYASQVWHPYKTKESTMIENVQKFALRVCSKNYSATYTELLELNNLPTLENRRILLQLCSLYKIINNLVHFPHILLPQHSYISERSAHHTRQYYITFARTHQHKESFIPSTLKRWNNLPDYCVDANISFYFLNITLKVYFISLVYL